MALNYIDTSAAFKLLANEEHADAFGSYYRARSNDDWVSSDLLRIELMRTVTRTWSALVPDAVRLLDAFSYLPIDEHIVSAAMVEPDPHLRALDAIHLVTARQLGSELEALITYDDRLAAAATDAGLAVVTPRDPKRIRRTQ